MLRFGIIFLKLIFIFSLSSCSLDEPDEFYSPSAGFLQVFITSDNADTTINILGIDYTISESDSMDLLVYQGKAYDLDSNYAILYKTINSWRQEEYTYNIIDWKSMHGYSDFQIFESHLPPMEYKSLTLGIIASVLEIGPYRIPISLPSDVDGVLSIPVDFIVSENGVTKITLSIKPFESMTRYQDSYVFDRMLEVKSIEYFNEDLYAQIIAESDLP